jgi:hypothetical protein
MESTEMGTAIGGVVKQRQMMPKFRKPLEIQQFLNELKYRGDGGARSPLVVEQTRKANCFDGAVFAAAALETLGFPPLIVDMEAKNDDDHVIAVYRSGGWGALAKSNTTLLRSREPVYRSLRELVMSYFDGYFNVRGTRSLLNYSAPVNLQRFDSLEWRTTGDWLGAVQTYLHHVRHYPILTRQMGRKLVPADPVLMRACFLDSDKKGLYQPK